MEAAPGEAPTTAGYQVKAPNTLTISAAAGGQKTYRWQLDTQLLTLDEENGPPLPLAADAVSFAKAKSCRPAGQTRQWTERVSRIIA
jgi:hypothetical protein